MSSSWNISFHTNHTNISDQVHNVSAVVGRAITAYHSDVIYKLEIAKLIICIVGVFVNSVEITVFLSKELRRRSSVMLACISGGYLIAVSVEIYRFILKETGVIRYPRWYWSFAVLYTIESIVYTAATLILVVLSYERWSAVSRPMSVRTSFVRQQFTDVILVASIFGAGVVYAVLRNSKARLPGWPRNDTLLFLYLLSQLVLAAGAATALAVTTVMLIRVLRVRRRNLTLLGTSPNVGGSTGTTKIIVVIAVLFILTAGIPRTAYTSYDMYNFFKDQSPGFAGTVASYCVYLIEVINFVSFDSMVYFAYNRKYRMKVLSMFRCVVPAKYLFDSTVPLYTVRRSTLKDTQTFCRSGCSDEHAV